VSNYIKARPTIYKGIQMRSRLEAAYAQHLDADNYPWEYEPECFADETGQYLPDFRIGAYLAPSLSLSASAARRSRLCPSRAARALPTLP
jgi:hypothetical protein